MAHDTEQPTDNAKKHHVQREDEITTTDDDITEILIPKKTTLSDRITKMMEKFASNHIGQMVLEQSDRLLKVLEDTAKWSLPQDDDIQLERPLPWIFFLSLIVCLRIVRAWLSIAGFLVGLKRVTPHAMVYYIQTKRRRLRAIRVQGLKTIKNREMERIAMYRSTEDITFFGNLRKLLRNAICNPEQYYDMPVARRLHVESGEAQCSKYASKSYKKRPREDDDDDDDDDDVDPNLTVEQMLDKYATEDSDCDSDYIPKEGEDNDTSVTSNSSSNNSAEEETVNKNSEKPTETTEESENSRNENKQANSSIVEVKENGGAKHRTLPKPLVEIKKEPLSDVDNENQQVCSPEGSINENGSSRESGETNESGQTKPAVVVTEAESATATATATEVAQQETPTQTKTSTKNIAQNLLAALHLEENKQKSTPGHESAASLKPPTTTVKTGSLQDFHTIFHPAPLVKDSTGAVETSTPEEADPMESPSTDLPTTSMAGVQQKKHKPFHYKQNQPQNNKSRNKNRH